MDQKNSITISWDDSNDVPPLPPYNKLKGGENMNNKFVTHKEFYDAVHNIDKHFDHIDTKFAEQTLGLYKMMISIGLGVIAILGFLITLVTFLK